MCREYVQYLHPLHLNTELLLPNTQGKSLDQLSRIVRESGKQHNIYFQIATENCDVGAMESAHVCKDRQRDQVATQMSHSRQTQKLHYIRMKSQAEACEGYKIANLCQGAGSGLGKRKCPFTNDETETVELYIDSYTILLLLNAHFT